MRQGLLPLKPPPPPPPTPCQICQCPLPKLAPLLLQDPSPLASSASRLFSSAASLQADLRLSEQGLAVALRRAPAALAAPRGRVGALVGVLRGRMGVGDEVALDLLLQVGGGAICLMGLIWPCFDCRLRLWMIGCLHSLPPRHHTTTYIVRVGVGASFDIITFIDTA